MAVRLAWTNMSTPLAAPVHALKWRGFVSAGTGCFVLRIVAGWRHARLTGDRKGGVWLDDVAWPFGPPCGHRAPHNTEHHDAGRGTNGRRGSAAPLAGIAPFVGKRRALRCHAGRKHLGRPEPALGSGLARISNGGSLTQANRTKAQGAASMSWTSDSEQIRRIPS